MTFTHDSSEDALEIIFEEHGDQFMVFSAGGREYDFVVERIANIYRGVVRNLRTMQTIRTALYIGKIRKGDDNDIRLKIRIDWQRFIDDRRVTEDADSPFIAEKVKRAIRDANPRNTQEEPRD